MFVIDCTRTGASPPTVKTFAPPSARSLADCRRVAGIAGTAIGNDAFHRFKLSHHELRPLRTIYFTWSRATPSPVTPDRQVVDGLTLVPARLRSHCPNDRCVTLSGSASEHRVSTDLAGRHGALDTRRRDPWASSTSEPRLAPRVTISMVASLLVCCAAGSENRLLLRFRLPPSPSALGATIALADNCRCARDVDPVAAVRRDTGDRRRRRRGGRNSHRSQRPWFHAAPDLVRQQRFQCIASAPKVDPVKAVGALSLVAALCSSSVERLATALSTPTHAERNCQPKSGAKISAAVASSSTA